MTKAPPTKNIISLGHLPDEVSDALCDALNEQILLTDADRIALDSSRARVLLVGDDVAIGDLQILLLNLRESEPSLVVLAVHSSDVQRGRDKIDELVDASFGWPAQRAQLLREVQIATARPGLASTIGRAVGAGLIGAVVSTAMVVAIWETISRLQLLPSYILPSPTAVVQAMAQEPGLYVGNAAVTAAEAAVGFLVGNAIAIGSAVALYRFAVLRRFSLPVLTGLQAIPVIALAPLLTIWFGTGFASKAAMAAVVCYFPLVAGLLASFVSTDSDLMQLFAFHRAPFHQTASLLLFPGSYPALVAGLRISGGLAVVGAIVAEFAGSDRGIGYLLLNATYRLETDKLFAGLTAAALLGIAFANLPHLLRLTQIGRFYARRPTAAAKAGI